MLVNLEHTLNAPIEILVTEFGIVYDDCVFPHGYRTNVVFALSNNTPFSTQ